MPRETLLKLADRFDEVAQPLFTAGLMTSIGLALTLRRHLPAHIRKSTISAMLREDKKRTRGDLPLLDKDELIELAQQEEGFLLEFETEMRAAGQEPDARQIEDGGKNIDIPKLPSARSPERKFVPMNERLGPLNRDIRDKTAPGNKQPETRVCHHCKKTGHILRDCPTKPINSPNPSQTTINPSTNGPVKRIDIQAHKTDGHTCEACGKLGHTEKTMLENSS